MVHQSQPRWVEIGVIACAVTLSLWALTFMVFRWIGAITLWPIRD